MHTERQTTYIYESLREDTLKACSRDYRADRIAVPFHEYPDALVLPALADEKGIYRGGAFLSDEEIIADCAVPGFCGSFYKHDEATDEIEKAIWMGYMLECYGHAIADSLRWQWFIQTDDYRKLISEGYKVILISLEPLAQYQLQLLQLSGLNVPFERITKPTKVKQLIMPTPSIVTDSNEQNYWRPEFKQTIDFIVANALKQAPNVKHYDKIYLSRKNWKSSDYESAVEKLMRQQGFKIISPQDLSIAEQIATFHYCRCLAATEGSISHNGLFLQDGSKEIILRKTHRINKYSLYINNMNNLDAVYIDCALSILVTDKDWWDGPFFIYINQNLADYFGIDKPIFPLRLFKKYANEIYCKYSMPNVLKNINGEYADILKAELDDIHDRIEQKVDRIIRFFPAISKYKNGIVRRLYTYYIKR